MPGGTEGLHLGSFSDILHSVQQSDGVFEDRGCLESDTSSVPKRPYSSRVRTGLVSDVFREEMLEPDIS